MEMSPTPREAAYWQAVYEEGSPGWDKNAPAPPLVRAIRQAGLPQGTRVLVPGCGFGHEALFLAQEGLEVTAVDFAPAAIKALKARAGDLPLRALERDLFSLDQDHAGFFELVVEHTCFCAIPIQMRDAYALVMARVLGEGGRVIGLFYETDREEGPPFRTTREDIHCHFSPHFEVVSLSRPHDSFEGRQGKEWLAELLRRRR